MNAERAALLVACSLASAADSGRTTRAGGLSRGRAGVGS